MTHNNTTTAVSIEKALPIMRERVREQILLMFLIDDFSRTVQVNQLIVESAAKLFCGPISDNLRANLEHKLTSEMLTLFEMARNVTTRGEALIKQVEKVMEKVPSWDNA